MIDFIDNLPKWQNYSMGIILGIIIPIIIYKLGKIISSPNLSDDGISISYGSLFLIPF
jgi:hypothetical protein